MAPPARLLVATCCLLVALLGQTVSAAPSANWGQDPSVATCRLDATWEELIERNREGTGNVCKTASLGDLETSPRFQVWLCEEGHPCANGTSSYFCFVYDEELKIFVPWAPNSILQIVADTGWNTAYFSAAFCLPGWNTK
ncbi:hypothetical protein T484DRAFT_1767800 [Baffinella frigidus]|nr:hypothetical protein T484DRAFT_1767800 [Cryptophyta sp. CCMP2293]